MKALKNEINGILTSKLADAITTFEAGRDADIAELVELRKAVETIATERAGIVEAMGKLNPKKARDLGERNRLDVKLRWIDRQLEGKKDQAGALMTRLIEIEVDPRTLNLLLNFRTYHEKRGGKNENG